MQTPTLEEKVYTYTAPKARSRKKVGLANLRSEWGLVGLILAGALALRLYNLTRLSLWFDESADLSFAYENLLKNTFMLSMPTNPHPPLFYPIMHLWMKNIGTGEFAVRFFSVIMSMLTLGLVYVMARKWLNQRVALISLLLLATSSFHLYWSQSIRPYVFFTLLVTISMALAFWVSEKPDQNWRWAFYGLSASVIIYTHYLAFHIVLAQAIFLTFAVVNNALTWRAMRPRENQAAFVALTINKRWVNIFRLIITYGLVAASFLPYLKSFQEQTAPNHRSVYVATGPEQLVETFQALSSWLIPEPYLILVGALFIPLFLFGFSRIWQMRPLLAIWLGCWVFLPILTSWFSSLIIPNFRARFFIFCLPAFLLVVAYGIWEARFKWRWLPYLLLALTLGFNAIACLTYNKDYQNQDWRSLVNYVVANRQEGDVILMGQPGGWAYLGFDYYYVYQSGKPGNMPRIGLDDPPTNEMVQNVFKNRQRVWVVIAFDYAVWYDKFIKPQIPPDFKSAYYQRWPSTDQDGISVQLLQRQS